MKWRQSDTRDHLYEQDNLSATLATAPDMREHYLSLVIQPVLEARQRLVREALDWTRTWKPSLRYVQNPHGLHSTVLEFGAVGDTKHRIHEIAEALKEYATIGPARVTIEAPKIGGSGINREVRIDSPDLQEVIIAIAKRLNVEPPAPKSISLVRYLIGDDGAARNTLRGFLDQLAAEEESPSHQAAVEWLTLVHTDKVAYSFEVLAECRCEMASTT